MSTVKGYSGFLQEIRLSSMNSKAQNDDIADEQDMAAAVLNAAKKTIISKVPAFVPRPLLNLPWTPNQKVPLVKC